MRKIGWTYFGFSFLCLFGTFGYGHAINVDLHYDTTGMEAIRARVQALVEQNKTVGLSIGIRRGSDTRYIEHHGWSNVETQQPVDRSTQFCLASLTKPFTALAIALLIEKDLLSLQDSLTEFFPDFPNGGAVTIYHLLSHTSGIPDWWQGGLPSNTPNGWVNSSAPHRYIQAMKNLYLFEPGSQYVYSNTGYLLLGEIIELVTGHTYADYLQRNILIPLQLQQTGFIQGADRSAKKVAVGYGIADSSSLDVATKFRPVPYIASDLKSAGGLLSTASDLLRWSNAIFEGQLISRKLLAKMTIPATLSNGRPSFENLYLPPGVSMPAPPSYMQKSGYGLGFNLDEMFGQPVIWHSGGMPGFNAIWAYLPNTRITLVLLSNTDNGVVTAFEDLMQLLTQLR